jgi:predicted ArsR family transcriptional regulator
MTELATTANARPKRSSKSGAAYAPVLVSGYRLAAHFGVVRQHIDQLTAQGVIEHRADGRFVQGCG